MNKDKVLVIPRHLVFVKFIDVPSLEEAEIGRMAEYQAVKEIPHPKEELMVSYRNLGSYREGFSSLMLAVATKDMIYEKLEEARHLNIQPENIRLYTELLYLYLLKKDVVRQDRTVFVIHIGKEDSEIMMIDRGRLVFSRGFKNTEGFLEEIDRSILAYERDKDNPAIEDVIVTYASDIDTEEIEPYIREHFAVPVNFYEYSEDPARSDVVPEIDLLPKEISHKKLKSERRQELALTYSLAGCIAVLFFAFFSFKMYDKNKNLEMFSARISEVESRIQGLDKLVKKTEIAKANIEQGRFINNILEESYNLVPPDIIISELDYNGEDSIFYKGLSRDMSSVLGFVKTLEASKYFKKAEVKYASKKKIKGEEFTDFNVRCWLNP